MARSSSEGPDEGPQDDSTRPAAWVYAQVVGHWPAPPGRPDGQPRFVDNHTAHAIGYMENGTMSTSSPIDRSASDVRNADALMQAGFMDGPYRDDNVPISQSQPLNMSGYVQSAAVYSTVNVFGHGHQAPQPYSPSAAQPYYAIDNGSSLGAHVGYDVTPQQETDLGSTHSNMQPRRFVCHACARPSGFGRLQDLKRHIGHKHEIEFVACDVPGCGKKFPKARPDYMRRHFDKDH